MNRNYFDCIRRGITLNSQWTVDDAWDINTVKDTVNHYILNEINKWYDFEDEVFSFEVYSLLNS